MPDIIQRLKHFHPFLRYYAIIGKYTREIIGVCVGEDGKRDVLEEEPGSTFIKISKRKFDSYGGDWK